MCKFMFRLKFLSALTLLLIGMAGVNKAYLKPKEVVYELVSSGRPDVRFNDVPCGVYVSTKCDQDNSQIHDTSELTPKMRKKVAKMVSFRFTPDISEFFNESFKKYVRNTGIPTGSDRNNDYYLNAKLREYKIMDNIGSAKCSVIIEWELENPNNRVVLDGTAKGNYTMSPGQNIVDALDKAYSKALEDINWREIVAELKNSQPDSKRADQEKQKQVTGDGDTALEHTVIRWYIVSSPNGADVSWRVVSSTPDVKNTNASYVGTTPYETTESFDIRGLKWENSGNVQIEITCDKPGYLPQRRRFNLRQAIEQREISAKFNLVKDNEAHSEE